MFEAYFSSFISPKRKENAAARRRVASLPPPPSRPPTSFDSVYFSRFRIFLVHYQREATLHRRATPFATLPYLPAATPTYHRPPLASTTVCPAPPCASMPRAYGNNNVNDNYTTTRRIPLKRGRERASFLKVSFLILTLTNTQRFIISCFPPPPTYVYTVYHHSR